MTQDAPEFPSFRGVRDEESHATTPASTAEIQGSWRTMRFLTRSSE